MLRPTALCLIGCVALFACAAGYAERETHAGLPAAQPGTPQGDTQVLQNPGFLVGYSAQRRQPLWVAYRAASLTGTPTLGPRPHGFEADGRVAVPVTSRDYGKSRYTRGHLAPNFVIGKLYGAAAQRATFLMSNISPQRRRLNVLVWQRLEEAEADEVAPAAGELWVLTGPVFGAKPAMLKSGIPVPEAFYRIWLDLSPDGPRALAFIVPQDVCGTEPLSRYLSSVDEIEQRTQLDFFHEMDDGREAVLERSRDSAGWGLEAYDRKPPRYADHFHALQCPD
ncbi:MAG: DNA/RNA non-specific endonuclease [Burkholderiales bacterium]